jgi:hypothetical protein
MSEDKEAQRGLIAQRKLKEFLPAFLFILEERAGKP